MSAILVTGGAGFIGSHVCECLIARGERVVCYDNLDSYYDPASKMRNLATLYRGSNFALVRGDILDASVLEATVREFGIDRIVHLAARTGVRRSLQDPGLYQQVNVCGSTYVLEAARKAGVRSLVIASSSSVYGASSQVPFREDDPADRPISPYAASKRAVELAACVHAHLYKMDIICHRFFTVYGPRQRPDMAIAQFVRRVREGRPVSMYGDGSTRRDYTFVDDIVKGLTTSLDRATGMGFQIFNLGNSHTVSLRELIAAIGDTVGREPQIVQEPEQPGDVKVTYADIEKAQRLLDYRPTTSIQEGLARYIAWLETEETADVGT